MGLVIPFRRRSRLPIVLGAIAAAVFAFAATMAFLNWRSSPGHQAASVEIIRPIPKLADPIEVIDGDTVRMKGTVYRLTGFDTPERGDKARCDDERRRAEAATARLRTLFTSGNARLERVACACRPGQEGTPNCNYRRLCGSLTIGGRDVGQIDFDPSEDVVQLDGFDTSFDPLGALSATAGGAELDLGQGDSVLFLGRTVAEFSANDFQIV